MRAGQKTLENELPKRDACFDRLQQPFLPHALSRLLNELNAEFLKHLRKVKLTPQQFRVLQVIGYSPGISVGKVASKLVVEQPIATRLIDQLQTRRYVTRRRDGTNSRSVQLFLTPGGLRVARAISPYAYAIVENATASLNTRQKKQLLELLNVVAERVRSEGYKVRAAQLQTQHRPQAPK